MGQSIIELTLKFIRTGKEVVCCAEQNTEPVVFFAFLSLSLVSFFVSSYFLSFSKRMPQQGMSGKVKFYLCAQ